MAPSVSLLMVFVCTSGTDVQVAELKVYFELHVWVFLNFYRGGWWI